MGKKEKVLKIEKFLKFGGSICFAMELYLEKLVENCQGHWFLFFHGYRVLLGWNQYP